MIPRDFLYGSYEFSTEVEKDGDVWVAKANGYSAKHEDMSQAINDLNVKLNDAMERGELVPDMS